MLDAEIKAAEARQQAQEAERQFHAEQGENASHEAEMAKCAGDVHHFFDQWLWTYNPRLVGKTDPVTGRGIDPYIRFHPWPRQHEFIDWFMACLRADEPGLCEKSRDQGATYIALGIFLHQWLYAPGFKGTCTSIDEDKVDLLDDPDSMFEKLRIMVRRLPMWMLPKGFSWQHHSFSMRLINPANGAIITGESGDSAGRSGRSTAYLVDEAAFLQRPAGIEAGLAGNTDCVIWMSTVHPTGGLGNFFARKRHSGAWRPDQIFRLHWRDDPRKDQAWADAKKASLSDPTTWEAEYEINYAASAEGICIPAAWVQSSQRLKALEPGLRMGARRIAGVDVGAGKAQSIYVDRAGAITGAPVRRGDPDTTGTANWALDLAKTRGAAVLNYDAQGPGVGVTSTFSLANTEGLAVVPVNTGVPPTERLWPDERTSEEMFVNLRAELWWLARMAFQRTHEHVLFLEGKEGGVKHPLDELIALGPDATLASQLSLLKWFKNEKGKIIIESKDSLKKRGIPSPDYADAFVMTFLEPDDTEAAGIFKRPWFRLWPAEKKLPEFMDIIVVLRTAFDDERTPQERRGLDYSSMGVYGIFNVAQQFNDQERKKLGLIGTKYAALLCDFWSERLSFPDVLERVREAYRAKWGSPGRRPSIVIVEEAGGTDRTVRQSLTQYGVPAWPFSVPDQSRTMRAHQAAPLAQQGSLFVPESAKPDRKGLPRDWVEPMLKQACSFNGRGSIEVTTGVDQMTAALIYLMLRDTLKATPMRKAMPDPDEEQERKEREALLEYGKEKRGKRGNPYGI